MGNEPLKTSLSHVPIPPPGGILDGFLFLKKVFLLCDKVSLCSSGTQSVAEAGPKLEAILLPQPPKCWDYRYVNSSESFDT